MTQQPFSEAGAPGSPRIRIGKAEPTPGREPLRHLLLGSPQLVSRTIHQLHVLRFAEARSWSHQLKIPDHDLLVTPYDGEVLSILVRYLSVE
jgi:hypothetical protein